MVAHTLRSIDPNVNIIEVRASRGKHVRRNRLRRYTNRAASLMWARSRRLETQMTQMTIHGYEGDGSPDRVDALVWLMTELSPAWSSASLTCRNS